MSGIDWTIGGPLDKADRLTIVIDERGRRKRHANAGICVQPFDKPRELGGQPEIIRVEQRDIVRRCLANARVARAGEAPVRLAHEAQTLIANCLDDFGTAIHRSVVDDDDLEIAKCLILNRTDRVKDITFRLIQRNDDGDAGHGGSPQARLRTWNSSVSMPGIVAARAVAMVCLGSARSIAGASRNPRAMNPRAIPRSSRSRSARRAR